MSIEFTDNTVKVKNELKNITVAFLSEVGGELVSRTVRNSRTDTGQTKGSYEYEVKTETNVGTVYVGSNYDNAIYEEYGTGEYALNGDGRKGGWYIPEEELTAKAKSKMKKVYGKDGKVFYYTKGKTPNRPMYKAFISFKDAIKRGLENKLKQL